MVIARDVPSLAKRRIVQRLMFDMPSVFVRVNLSEVDVPAMQVKCARARVHVHVCVRAPVCECLA